MCNVSVFFSVFPLSIGNDVNAVFDTFFRFYESQLDIVVIKLLVRNSVAGRSKQCLNEFRLLETKK